MLSRIDFFIYLFFHSLHPTAQNKEFPATADNEQSIIWQCVCSALADGGLLRLKPESRCEPVITQDGKRSYGGRVCERNNQAVFINSARSTHDAKKPNLNNI